MPRALKLRKGTLKNPDLIEKPKCTYCGKEHESFLGLWELYAPVGKKRLFVDFCGEICLKNWLHDYLERKVCT